MKVSLYTLDVGHGLCQIIVFPGRQAVVVDGGSFFTREVPNEFLELYVDTILAYVATHNDDDHVPAAINFLSKPKFGSAASLKAIWAAVDRGSCSPVPMVEYAQRRESEGSIGEFRYGTIQDNDPPVPRKISKGLPNTISLELLYPAQKDTIGSIRAQRRDSRLQNRASACLRLRVGECVALITGDIDLFGLTRIRDKYQFGLSADVLTVPHHGCHMAESDEARSWDSLVREISPAVALVSCGYHRGRALLSEQTLAPFVNLHIPVCCTQIMETCHADFASFHPSVLPPVEGVPQMSGDPRFPKAVGCFGSVVTVFDENGFEVKRLADHAAALDMKVGGSGRPLCRPRNAR